MSALLWIAGAALLLSGFSLSAAFGVASEQGDVDGRIMGWVSVAFIVLGALCWRFA